MRKILAAAPGVDYTVAPPGADKFQMLINIVGWSVVGLCVVGFLFAGAAMVIQHRRGDGGGENMTKLGWVAAGSIIVGGASSWATTLAG